MIDTIKDLQNFLFKVKEMRGRQRAYFMSRNDTNLNLAKKAERDVDAAIGLLEKRGYKPVAPVPDPTQDTLKF
jgi:hypothetical protein